MCANVGEPLVESRYRSCSKSGDGGYPCDAAEFTTSSSGCFGDVSGQKLVVSRLHFALEIKPSRDPGRHTIACNLMDPFPIWISVMRVMRQSDEGDDFQVPIGTKSLAIEG